MTGRSKRGGMRNLMTVAGAVVLASSLAACGGGGSELETVGYCREFKDASEVFTTVDANNFPQVVDIYHRLAAAAPSEIDADWKELDGTMAAVDEALREAGISFAEMSSYMSTRTLEGADRSEVEDVRTAASALSRPEFKEAAVAIQVHAKSTCNVDLGEPSP
jgi:hypothetical protein